MPTDQGSTPGRTAIAAAVLVVVSITAYLPALATGFTSDDFFILARVKALDGLVEPWAYFQFGFFNYYRPVAFLTHASDWHLWGLNAFGFHLTNVFLHTASTVLVFMIGRRLLLGVRAACVGALFFALHPASHEAVYWIAARFDLLATCFTLAAIWCLADDRRAWRALGVVAFALGLLSKESAISVLMIAPAWDVFVTRRDVRAVIRRLLPVVGVVAAYGVARSFGADLDAMGGNRRVAKLVATAVILALIVYTAWRRGRPASGAALLQPLPWWLAVGIAAIAGGALWGPPALAAAAARVLASTAYAAFYLLSPVVFPAPPPEWFHPMAARDALPGLVVLWGTLAILTVCGRAIARHATVVFLGVWLAAALLPVSSMTGGLRYLYLATAAVSLLTAWLLHRLPRAGRLWGAAVAVVVLALSLAQLLQAGRAWRAGSEMTHDGVTLMAASLPPCGTKDVLLLTAPAGIGGVYANFLYEAFDVLEGCSPRSFFSLLRVVDRDVHVDVSVRSDGAVELRVPAYGGNIIASEDLSNFTVRVPPGYKSVIETPAGSVETFADGESQIFRVRLTAQAAVAARFYYSDGQIRR